MSDNDLNKMSSMSGFNFSPEMIRNATKMMNNFSDDQLSQTKNMANTMFNNKNSNDKNN